MRLRRTIRSLRGDAGGTALLEFAISFPVLLALGMYGIDTANLALTNLRLNQIALNLADNASRVGVPGLSSQELREIDISDIFDGARSQGAAIGLAANSRIILSSLERDATGTQRIHWQRCFGSRTGGTYESNYGRVLNADGSTTTGNAGVTATNGMGATGFKVNAPTNNSGVMFVELNYRYTPMFSWLSTPADLHYVASFIVRDPRDFARIRSSTGVTPSYCGYTVRISPT